MQEKYPHKVGEYFILTKNLEPGEVVQKHYHKGRVETCHILKGVGTFVVEETRIKKSIGESITIKKSVPHTIKNNGDITLKWLEVSVILDHRIEMSLDSHTKEEAC